MGVDLDRRMAVGQQVSRLLCHPEAEGAFPARLASGKRHVIVALPTDTCRETLCRVKTFRGPVNVAVPAEAGAGIEVIVFYPSADGTDERDVDACEVGPDSELGLLIALLRRTRRSTRVRLAKPKYNAELIDREIPEFADC